MSVTVFAFYLFAVSALTGGLFTVISRNPVHSVLWLILSFISSAGLFVLLGAEFVAMLATSLSQHRLEHNIVAGETFQQPGVITFMLGTNLVFDRVILVMLG